MKINKSKFVTSVADKSKILIDEKSQIAFVGRSNVGKSSL
jgi:GTP-binding protein EngB required for normal cell division